MTKLCLLLAAASLALPAGTFTGVISESMCGQSHKAMNMGPDPDCVRACVKADKNVKYVLLANGKSYKLSDQKTPEQFAAQQVRVHGKLWEKTGVIEVQRIEPVR